VRLGEPLDWVDKPVAWPPGNTTVTHHR